MTNQRPLGTILGVLTVLCFSAFVSPSLLNPEHLDVRNSIYIYNKESKIHYTLIRGNYPDNASGIINTFGFTITPHITDANVEVAAFQDRSLFDCAPLDGVAGYPTDWHMSSIQKMGALALRGCKLARKAVVFGRSAKLPSSVGLFKHYFTQNSKDFSACSQLLANTSPQTWKEVIIQICLGIQWKLVLPTLLEPNKHLLEARTLFQLSKLPRNQHKSTKLFGETKNSRTYAYRAKQTTKVLKKGYWLMKVFLHAFKLSMETRLLPGALSGLEVMDTMLCNKENPADLLKQLYCAMENLMFTSRLLKETKPMPDAKDVGQIEHTKVAGRSNQSSEGNIFPLDGEPTFNLHQSGLYTTIRLETGNSIFDVVANPSDTSPVPTDSDQIIRLDQLDVAALFCATTKPSDSDDPDPPEPEPIGEGQPD